jgi:hypothetical protein
MFDDGLGALARFYARGVSQAGAPSPPTGVSTSVADARIQIS